ncbi:MAG: MarR family transcriptional regulator [Alphaproteobacteria bacterium]|nr:MarR family transcriptional regulator [Alphaproteobacteria bacterium]
MTNQTLRLREFLPYRLSFTSNLVSERIAGVYAALFGLSIPEWRLVAVIAEEGRTTQQAIGVFTGMDKVTVSRAAIALVDRGLVTRSPNPDDKRSHLLSLSPAGRDLYATVAPKALEMEAEIFSCLTAGERRALAGFLERIDAAVIGD